MELPKAFTTIEDLPIGRWFKINSTGDLGYLFLRYEKPEKVHMKRLNQIWADMFDEYLKEFGMGESFHDYLESLTQLTIMICEQAIEFDSHRDAEMTILENSLKNVTLAESPLKFADLVSAVSKYMGYSINPNKESTLLFYSHLRQMKRAVEANKQDA